MRDAALARLPAPMICAEGASGRHPGKSGSARDNMVYRVLTEADPQLAKPLDFAMASGLGL